MKKLISILFILSAFGLSAQISDQWLLIISGFKNEADAQKESQNYDFETTVLNSANYTNLNPGWYIVCKAYPSEKAARDRSKSLNETGLKTYVKYSGAEKSIRYSFQEKDYYFVYGNKYLVFDFKVSNKQGLKGDVIGCEFKDDMCISTAKANKSLLPLKYLKTDKQFVTVYNIKGEQTSAQIIDFKVAHIQITDWHESLQWQSDGTSQDEIAKSKLKNCYNCVLVAELKISDGFDGTICHLGSTNIFEQLQTTENKALEAQAKSRVKETDLYKQDLDAIGSKADQISQNIKTFQANNQTYLLQRVEFGDYCENSKSGKAYKVGYFIWKTELGNLALVESVDKDLGYNVFPLIESKTKRLIGITSDDGYIKEIWLKEDKWKSFKKKHLSANLCD